MPRQLLFLVFSLLLFSPKGAIFLLRLQGRGPPSSFWPSGPLPRRHVAMETAPVPQLLPTSFIQPDSSSSLTVPPPPPHKSPYPIPDPPPPSSDLPPPPCQNPLPADDLPPPPPVTSDPPLPPYSHHIYRVSSSSVPSSSADPPPPTPPPQPQLPNSLPIPPRHQRPSSTSDHKGPAPPPQHLSYAQAARSSRGPSFVRAHAIEVESFAKIPRTGVNIICGSKEGIPSFSFVSADLPRVEELYSNALVMKFIGGRPSLEASQQEIISWGMEKSFSIGPLSSRAFLLRFQEERDLLKVLTRPSSILITFPYKIFRWHNLCHLSEDSSMAPVWISLPRLPMQCFIPEFLESVGNKLGRFLCFDRATTTLARPSVARICVELDLSKPLPQFIWVGLFEGFKQSIIYERLPKYCNQCHRLGHATAVCSKPCTVAPVPVDGGHPAMLKDRTPPVRDNVDRFDRVLPRAISPSIAPPPPLAHSSQNGKQPRPVQLHPSLGHRAEQGQCPGSPSLSSTSLNSSLPESSHGFQPPNDAPTLPLPADSTLVQPPILAEPQLIPHTKSKSKTQKIKPKKKSVSFKLPGQTNLSANVEFWNAVNNQISNIEQNPTNISSQMAILAQARLNKSSDDPSTSLAPTSNHVGNFPPPPINQMFYKDNGSGDESSGSSLAADSPPISPCGLSKRLLQKSCGHKKPTYASDGEAQPTEPSPFRGHSTDDLLDKLPLHSKRNKRHPNQPLNVQLRVRKDPNSTLL